jgi:hypothetical protein
MAYNQAPVVKGNEEYAARVELLRTWLDSYRGPTPTLDLPTPTLDTPDPTSAQADTNTPAPARRGRSVLGKKAGRAAEDAGGEGD